ncbi:tetratricopeptide repeat protein [Halomonas sp. 1390]|uniref:tetratricopeptide repeat protein n=1 Tax=Halomonas sp. B23F22_3 TaxID=3459516 RepID=UPI00373FA6F3
MIPRLRPALRAILLLLLAGLPAAPLLAATPSPGDESVAAGIEHLQRRWAEIHYAMPADEQAKALEALAAEADRRVAAHPEAAGLQIWAGIVRSTQAGASGGLGALSLVKDARRDLEQALAIDPLALDGSAYTSLGALYYQVPGWPLAFGDDDQAERYLKRALSIDPDGLDSLYFWGDYLHEQGRDAEARQALEKALQAPPRPGRERADAGRREEVRALLETLGT